MFNLAVDSKLRGCDVVALKVEDVAPSGYAVDRANVRQKKTGQPVKFELTEQTRQAIDNYVRAARKKPGEFLFTGRRGSEQSMTTRQYARLVSGWIAKAERREARRPASWVGHLRRSGDGSNREAGHRVRRIRTSACRRPAPLTLGSGNRQGAPTPPAGPVERWLFDN
jgi:integrase